MADSTTPDPEFDTKAFRSSVGRFATGVTIITGRSLSDQPVGLTANSFTSVSLDPPLVLFCLDRRADSLEGFGLGRPFAVNVLSEDQEQLSNRFATSGADKYAGVSYSTWSTGAPILDGCLANLECTVEQSLDGGDHLIIVGKVQALHTASAGTPLLFFGGRYARLPA